MYTLGIDFPELVRVGVSFPDQPTSNPSELPVECGKVGKRLNRLLGLFLNKGVEDCRGYEGLPRVWIVPEEGFFEGVPVGVGSFELR